jgi:hypothetical protein
MEYGCKVCNKNKPVEEFESYTRIGSMNVGVCWNCATVPDGMDRCTKCHVARPIEEFDADTRTKNGRAKVCQTCRPTVVGSKRVTPEGTSWCSGCQQFLVVAEFNIDTLLGYQHYCRRCQSTAAKNWRAKKKCEKN